ncbi:MAG: hypothetical protein M1825_002465 [Sarcosagium campestre]|nr:MAG: hypothetical protein M1825_002465 [Sarcosagium campestre]
MSIRRTSTLGSHRSRRAPLEHVAPIPESSTDLEWDEEHDSDTLESSHHGRFGALRSVQWTRYISFACAILSCLCAGSITAYSLYGPLFLSRLRYTQLQVNIVSITAELAMYLPVPVFGYLCDRYNPRPLSFLASMLFGPAYLLAAFTYQKGVPPNNGGDGWPFEFMVISFIGIGAGTSCMYLSAVTTCAKNFGRGKHKGIALAIPIAAFGLSGMWQSQVGSRLLYEKRPDGSRGEVDVYRYFLFLGLTLLAVGLVGAFGLRIVDEEDLIDDAVEELERSGLLEESEFFRRSSGGRGYGTVDSSRHTDDDAESQSDIKQREAEERRKKTWLLNAGTRRFLKDRTMWALAGGFLLVTGPGETFINNLGTIIGTLSLPTTLPSPSPITTPSTHVSIVALTSTIARLFTGTLTDLLAPTADTTSNTAAAGRRYSISRITVLITFAALLSLGLTLLASGAIQSHPERFWAVSTLVGAGYGAVFSLVPIVCSVVWGVENFGTNWGIVAMMPALGATCYSVLYSTLYEWAAARQDWRIHHSASFSSSFPSADSGGGFPFMRAYAGVLLGGSSKGNRADGEEDRLCYGKQCYAATFWVMALSVWCACALWLWAWRGRAGWARRGIAV